MFSKIENVCLRKMMKMLYRTYYREFLNDSDILWIWTSFSCTNTVRNAVTRIGIGNRIWEGSIWSWCCRMRPSAKSIWRTLTKRTIAALWGDPSVEWPCKKSATERKRNYWRCSTHSVKCRWIRYTQTWSKNQRSQHVLEKIGLRMTHYDDGFIYYRCDRDGWTSPEL